MRFLSVFKGPETTTLPSEEEMARMGAFIEQEAKAGNLLSTEGCMPSVSGAARVRRAGDKVTVTDGPFTEAKEVIGGFAILQTNSLDEAVAITKRFLEVSGEGECELRQLYEVPALERA
jgi:hypothetical protein